MRNGSDSRRKEEGAFHSRKEYNGRPKHSRSTTKAYKHHYSPSQYSTINSNTSKESKNSLELSSVMHNRWRHDQFHLHGEPRKVKPLKFEGEKMG